MPFKNETADITEDDFTCAARCENIISHLSVSVLTFGSFV